MHDRQVSGTDYWSQSADGLLVTLRSSTDGLSATCAGSRLSEHGPRPALHTCWRFPGVGPDSPASPVCPGIIAVGYAVTSEVAKYLFYRGAQGWVMGLDRYRLLSATE